MRGLGNESRLVMTLFIQQSVLAFARMSEEKESKTPRMWVDRVEVMMDHFKGDHSKCSILERKDHFL